MAASTVVTRTRRSTTSGTTEFPFSREMIPALAPGSDLAPFLGDYRSRAWEAYQKLPMPSTNDEAWRRTDLRGLDVNVRLPEPGADQRLAKIPKALLKPIAGKGHGGQIVLLPGGKSEIRLDAELSRQGVVFTDLRTAEKQHAGILANILGQVVKPDEGKFAALAAAMSQDGVLVYVPRFVEVKDPLHSILWGPGSGLAYFSHLVVWLDEGASATYVHESASPSEANGQALHAGTVEIHVGEGANLRFVELQSWGEHVWHFSHERARVGRDGNLDWTFGAVGSRLTKNFSELDLVGQGATGRMSGFYFTDGVQHLDHDTQQNHLAPHTTSDLLFKGALKDRSRSVWQGMIYVAPGAQKADGYQANRNLTLSANARADSIPGLEILADDVRCTHGATVGKMDSDQVFYLRSRGIPYREAERLIVEGFFDPIMQRIPFEGVRQRFQRTIETKMG
ncbi:MAG: Fe-S cluster assembly protein SufD [Anaerolineales bacterium]|nr:Fe-S cluster assembly protein SufD [Anaerolineales bacterium]